MLGGVFSHAQGYTSLNDLWAAFAFHAIFMILGMVCLARPKPAVQPA